MLELSIPSMYEKDSWTRIPGLPNGLLIAKSESRVLSLDGLTKGGGREMGQKVKNKKGVFD